MRADQWGLTMARWRWWVIGAWVAVLVAAGVAYPVLQSKLIAPDYGVTGSGVGAGRGTRVSRAGR